MFYRLLKSAGLRQVRFHDLRHTYASLITEAGASPKCVQEQLGHASIQVKMDIYSHLFPSGHRECVRKLDDTVPKGETAPQAHLIVSIAGGRGGVPGG